MLTVQSASQTPSITILFDTEGIEDFIKYLTFIRDKDESMHLGVNELDETPIDEEYFVVPHVKLVNLDKLPEIE